MCSVWCLNGVSGVSPRRRGQGAGGSGYHSAPHPRDGVEDIRLSLIINCPASTPELPLAWLGPQLNYRLEMKFQRKGEGVGGSFYQYQYSTNNNVKKIREKRK